MKKSVSVYCKQHNPVFAFGFTLRVLLCQGVTVLVAAAHGEPSALVMVVGFPYQAVAQVSVLDFRDQRDPAVSSGLPHMVDMLEFDIGASAEFDLFKILGIVELLEQVL